MITVEPHGHIRCLHCMEQKLGWHIVKKLGISLHIVVKGLQTVNVSTCWLCKSSVTRR